MRRIALPLGVISGLGRSVITHQPAHSLHKFALGVAPVIACRANHSVDPRQEVGGGVWVLLPMQPGFARCIGPVALSVRRRCQEPSTRVRPTAYWLRQLLVPFVTPATHPGIEPAPVLPSLGKRAGIEPALSTAGPITRLQHWPGHCGRPGSLPVPRRWNRRPGG